MRILALVSDENTYQPLVYEPLLRQRGGDFVGIALVPFTTRAMPRQRALRFLWDLYRPWGFAVKASQVARNRLLDGLERIVSMPRCYSMTRLAYRYGIELRRVEHLNSQPFLDWVRKQAPDVILSSQGHYVGAELRAIPRWGVLNKHAGLLPRYRGAYPVFWALLNGEREIGITIHFMGDAIDAGDILLQERIPVGERDTFESLYREVVRRTPILYLRALSLLESGDVPRLPNDDRLATTYSFPTRRDVHLLHRRGRRIL